MSSNLKRKANKKSSSKSISYVKNLDQILDLKKNWVQSNEQGFEAINMMVLKSEK